MDKIKIFERSVDLEITITSERISNMKDSDRRCPHRNRVDTPMYDYYFDKNGSTRYFVILLERERLHCSGR